MEMKGIIISDIEISGQQFSSFLESFSGTVDFLSCDNDFPRLLMTLSVVHAVGWAPFFIFIATVPVMAQPISPSVGYFVAWLGYTESALDPILVFMLSSFVNKLVCQTFKVVCGGCGKETKATRSSSPHSFQHV